jgi:hypothetical protein
MYLCILEPPVGRGDAQQISYCSGQKKQAIC